MKALALLGTMILVIVFLAAGMSDNGSRLSSGETDAEFANFLLGYKAKNQKIFKVYNPSNETVRINSITTTGQCDCTVPIWTTGQIKPGKHGLVMVVFKRLPVGSFEVPLKIFFYNKEDVVDESLTQNITVEGSFDTRKGK